MLNNGESYSRDKDPKRVNNRANRLKRRVKRLEAKAKEGKYVPTTEEDVSSGRAEETSVFRAKPTFRAKRAYKKLKRLKKKGKISDFDLKDSSGQDREAVLQRKPVFKGKFLGKKGRGLKF